MNQVNAALAAGTWTGIPFLYSWGAGTSGALGLGNTTDYSSPKQVGSLTTWSKVAGGNKFTVVIKTDGSLWAWGYNVQGQLGLGNITAYSSPKQVGALTTWSIVASSQTSVYAIKTNGTLWSWGSNTSGQLGLNSATYYFSSPNQVGALTTWSNVFPSGDSTLATKTDGTLWTWGYNGNGQLGLANTTNYSSPKQVGALTTWSKVSSANLALSIVALKTDGTIWTWGYNGNGQLGLGNITAYSSPKQVGALTTWTSVTGFGRALMAIKGGALWGWGRNTTYGVLGLGNLTNYSSPVQVGALTTWLSVAGGPYAATALKTDGTLWMWGQNSSGQLGLGNTTNYSSPKQVGSLTTWLTVANGYSHTIAIGKT